MRKKVMKMMLIDMLDLYAMENGTNDLFLMLYDYTLDSRINREDMNRIIIKELGNHRPYTTNTVVLKFAIEEFFTKYRYNITKLIDTMYYEYNPLTNKDIKEVTDRDMLENTDDTEHRSSTGDIDNTDRYTTGQTETTTSEDKVSAYDSSAYQPKDFNNGSANRSTEHSAETTSDIKSTVDTNKDTDTKTAEDITKTTTGKDGDTSYQTLIEQERRLAEFNIFNWIINQMRKELFLLVY